MKKMLLMGIAGAILLSASMANAGYWVDLYERVEDQFGNELQGYEYKESKFVKDGFSDVYTFNITKSQDPAAMKNWGYFEMTAISQADPPGVTFSFHANQAGVDAGYGDNKIKEWFLKGASEFFNVTDNYQFATGNGGTASPLDFTLAFLTGVTWDDFAAAIEAGKVYFMGHVQETDPTINRAEFTWTPERRKEYATVIQEVPVPPVTPEPATMLILGLGMVGAGLARRRMSR